MERWPVPVALVAVCALIASFVVELEMGSTRWDIHAVNRGSAVLVGLALVGALVFERRPNSIAPWAQAAAAATSVAFMIVALTKLYEPVRFGLSLGNALAWGAQASVLAWAALVFGLSGLRRSSTVLMGGLATAVGVALGCAGYAVALQGNPDAFAWWSLAATGASLAACAGARIERR